MSLAYITAPYTEKSVIKGKDHIYGKIKDQSFINFLNVIESVVEEAGFKTFIPHRDIHQWGKIYIEPEDVMKQVWRVIKECDLVVSYPEHSRGPNVELGMAISLNKKSIILQHENDRVSLVHAGLNSITPTIIVKFRDLMDMKAKLREALIKFKQTSTLL